MALFQYQGKAEPVRATPESTTVDRWLPAWVQPARPLASAVLFATGVAAPVLPPVANAPTPVLQAPDVQPGRATRYAAGTSHVAPVATTPEATTADRHRPTFVQPGRLLLYAAGSTLAAPVSEAPESATAERWAPTLVQPDRTPRYAPGTSHVGALVPIVPATTTADRHAPTWPQPDRTPRYARGTDAAAPLSEAPEATSADRWAPTSVQPSRTPRYAAGTPVVGPLAPLTGADQWQPGYVQPGRTARYATGTSHAAPVAPVVPPTLSVDRWGPSWPQPDRTARYARGTEAAGPVSLSPESTAIDRWAPTLAQPSRAARYAPGTRSVLPADPPAPPAVPAFDWFATQPQPDRTPRYAPGTPPAGPVAPAGPGTPTGPPPPAVAPYRDRGLLKLAADLLRATKEFDDVFTWGLPEVQGAPADDAKLACLELLAWEEADQSNDYDAIPQDRTARFLLTLLVRAEDPDLRDDEIDRLYCVCANALNGVSIGGVTYPDWTRLRRGAWQPARAPERRMTVQGQFTYGISHFSTHATDPD